MSTPVVTAPTFEDARLDALEFLTLAQDVLVVATECGTVQRRAKQDALSLIHAAKAELRKAAPLPTDSQDVA